MTKDAHLWAVGYDDMERASQVRAQIVHLGWDTSRLLLDDVSVVVRPPDGSFTLDREPLGVTTNILGVSAVGFIAGLVIGAPMVGAAVGAMLASAGSATLMSAGIADDFVTEVKKLMRPGTSALFVLDHEGDMYAVLHGIRGLGGTVLKTNVDVERTRLIQSTLAAAPRTSSQP